MPEQCVELDVPTLESNRLRLFFHPASGKIVLTIENHDGGAELFSGTIHDEAQFLQHTDPQFRIEHSLWVADCVTRGFKPFIHPDKSDASEQRAPTPRPMPPAYDDYDHR